MATIFRAPQIKQHWRNVGLAACLILVTPNRLVLTASGLKPHKQDSWSLPAVQKTAYNQLSFTKSFPFTLIGKDTFFGPPGLGPDYDWPNPTRKVTAYNQLSFTDAYNPTLISKDRFFGADGMGPSYDWPNPTRQLVRPITNLTWTQSLQTTTLPPPLSPFSTIRNWDFPNPIIQRIHPNTNRSWLVSLQSSTLAPDLPPFGLIRNQNQPNPTLPTRAVRPITLRPEELEIPLPVPFNQNNWPLPVRLLRPTSNYQFSEYYVQDDNQPRQPIEWPNPVRKRPYQHLVGFTKSRPTNYVEPSLLLRPRLDWPNPRINRKLVPDTGVGSLLAGTSAQPFAQTNWPNPATKPDNKHSLGFIQDRIRFFSDVKLSPFVNSDWPNPTLKNEKRSLLGFTYERRSYYIEPDPAKLFDWPNPLRKLTLVPDVGTPSFNLLRAEVVVVPPFCLLRNLDWPNPVLETSTVFLRTTTVNSGRIFGDGLKPLSVNEWVNPTGYIFSVGLRSHLHNPTISFLLGAAVDLPRLTNAYTIFLEGSRSTRGTAGFRKTTKRIGE